MASVKIKSHYRKKKNGVTVVRQHNRFINAIHKATDYLNNAAAKNNSRRAAMFPEQHASDVAPKPKKRIGLHTPITNRSKLNTATREHLAATAWHNKPSTIAEYRKNINLIKRRQNSARPGIKEPSRPRSATNMAARYQLAHNISVMWGDAPKTISAYKNVLKGKHKNAQYVTPATVGKKR